ncbi:RNA-guided endonuclease InsQ/TnpB family protein [Paracoccus litorisediminis]|uniref:RNA-guided endonuclease InsQ/TnpB family protein n=1 Tax=Paracoccus litorisediminis TaxID=2006130 RepID=UPI00372E09F2
MSVNRRLTYKLCPSKAQAKELERHRLLHQQLYNAALQERREAWSKGVRVTKKMQERALKEFKHDLAEWAKVHTHSMQLTLKRLDLAFEAFFRRVKAKEKAGYPRFKPRDRYPGWSYKEHGNGFRFAPNPGWRHGWLKLSGIGRIQARGVARTPGRVKTCDIVRKVDGWYASIVVETECENRPEARGGIAGLDWGVETFATIATQDGRFEAVPNMRHLSAEMEVLREDHRAVSRAGRGRKRSRRTQRAQRRLAMRMRKIAARRKDHAHKLSARLVRRFRMIVTEQLAVAKMTRSARGTTEAPGRNVAQKAGLNRSILDTAPADFLNMLGYKAEEAGSELILVDTRKMKPSQRCPSCEAVRKKALSERIHSCKCCGFTCGRDEAASMNLLQHGQKLAWDRAGVAA